MEQRNLGDAIRSGDTDLCIDSLNEGATLSRNSSLCGSCDPLIESLHWEQEETARLLIDRGARLSGIACSKHPHQNYTAAHYCARYNFASALTKVLDQCPGILFVASEVHPIFIAIANNSMDCLKIMLERS